MPLNTTIVINKSRLSSTENSTGSYSIQNPHTSKPKQTNHSKPEVVYTLEEANISAITLKIKSVKKCVKTVSEKKNNIYDLNNMAIPKEMKKKLDTSQWLIPSSIIVPSYRLYIQRKHIENEAEVYS